MPSNPNRNRLSTRSSLTLEQFLVLPHSTSIRAFSSSGSAYPPPPKDSSSEKPLKRSASPSKGHGNLTSGSVLLSLEVSGTTLDRLVQGLLSAPAEALPAPAPTPAVKP